MNNQSKVIVTGHGIETGLALQNFTNENLLNLVSKYKWITISGVHVVFSKTRHLFEVEINCNLTDHTFHVTDSDDDPYKALIKSSNKLAKKLRRFKRKIREDHRK